MASILLDTHALIWMLANEALDNRALLEIAKAQAAGTLYVSMISAWEAGGRCLETKPHKKAQFARIIA